MGPRELQARLQRLANRRGWTFRHKEGRGHTLIWVNGRSTAILRHARDIGPGLLRKIVETDLGPIVSEVRDS